MILVIYYVDGIRHAVCTEKNRLEEILEEARGKKPTEIKVIQNNKVISTERPELS